MLPDYLWGIETYLHQIYESLKKKSFQTTYEELKHTIQLLAEEVYNASRLPMRNWNSPESFVLWGCGLSFQTTYEELKPCHIAIIFWAIGLPLPDYLWGIETRFGYLCRHDNSWLPDYLWGIETGRLGVYLQSCRGAASRLPMRNWNSALPWQAGSRFALPDYLWGIETWEDRRLRKWIEKASRLPMRNWNWKVSAL